MLENPFSYGYEELRATAKRIRKSIIQMNSSAGAGHTGADLSQTDILTTLFFSVICYDLNFQDPDRDRFILSKGHGAGGFYCTLAEAGVINMELLSTYLAFDSALPGHPVRQKIKGVEVNTGALGHGLPVSVGLALAAKKREKSFRVFVLVGDGELQEGSNWEAAMSASYFGLDNLVLIIDRNELQLADRTEKIMRVEPLREKLDSFGFRVRETDGNDPAALSRVLTMTEVSKDAGQGAESDSEGISGTGSPLAVIARTIKGKGISFIENQPAWHHRIPKGDEIEQAIQELE